MKKLINFLFLVFLAESAFGQTYPFRTYSIEQGLSESVVNALAQDDEGYIWLGTGYGLNRFDGIRFESFFEEDGLNSNRIQSLYKDQDGILWIGTEEGVNYRRGDSIYTNPVFAPLSNSTVISIFQDRAGYTWFGTDGQGLWRYSGNGALIHYSTSNGLADNRIRAISEAENGDLWFATRNGITMLSNGNFRNYTTEDGLPDNRTWDIKAGNSELVWIASRMGLVRFDGEGFEVMDESAGLVNNQTRTISLTENGGVWVGTEEGLSFYDGENFRNYEMGSGLSNQIIYSSIIDREENIWLGTYGGGANLFLGDYFENFSTDHGLPNNLVISITEFEDKIWIGMYGGGITSVADGVFNDYGINRRLPDNQVYKIVTDSEGRMWIGMREGLARLENDNLKVFSEDEFPFEKVRDIMETDAGDFWISTYEDGIVRLDEDGYTVYNEENGLADNTVLKSIETADGSVWIATYGGVSQFKDGEFQSFAIQEGLPNNGVMNITEDNEGTVWASTFGGIAWFDGLRFQSITPEDGLPDRVCYFITQSRDGHYWIGTTNGIIRFEAGVYFNAFEEDREQAFQLLTKDQGLIADELNLGAVFEDKDGHFWFGSVEGVSHFDPSAYQGNPVPPQVHILGVNASGREYGSVENLKLPPDENFVEITYSGINFTAPNRIIYEYRLSEIDPDWQRTTSRSATYPSLPPGEYTFQVHARNVNGIWSEDIQTIDFSITAPFYLQWWFLLLIFSVIVGIILLFYNYYRVRKMVDIERMRVRIASDLHDDVGASLTEIALQSDFLQAGDLPPDFSQSLSQIGKQCRRIVSSLDDIVWSIDARNDTLGDLTDRMQDYVLNTLEQKNMYVKYDFENLNMDNKVPVSLKENLYLIFKESVNNIAKYSNGDLVHIKMHSRNGGFEFSISDNGTSGAGLGKKKSGQGLRNMEMRAKRIGADINFNNENGFSISVKGKLK
ncbi:MAG: two-component regulator propeller domain-containing protein [Balneolaceae bacterium]